MARCEIGDSTEHMSNVVEEDLLPSLKCCLRFVVWEAKFEGTAFAFLKDNYGCRVDNGSEEIEVFDSDKHALERSKRRDT